MSKHKHIKLHNPIEKHFDVISGYHYYIFILLFASKIILSWHILNLIFLSPPIDFYCNQTEVKSLVKNFCPCGDPWWDRSVFTATMQTKFELLCESTWLISFSESMTFLGLLLGALSFGFLSDRYGRLKMTSFGCLILFLSGSLVAVMPTATSFTVMRFIEGFGAGGSVVTTFVLCIEYCGVRHRETITALYHVPINLSHVTMAWISYLLRDFGDFQLAVSIPVLFLVSIWWLMMESPKWLMDVGDIERAAKVMEKIGKFNRSPYEDVKEKLEAYQTHQANKAHTKVNFWQIFKHKRLCLNLGCMSFTYFVCGMGYYGVSQYIGKMSGDIHLNVAISGLLLLPGTLSSVFLLKILRRRTFLMGTNFLSGLLMIIVIFIPTNLNLLKVICACVCNCFFFMSFIIVFLYGVELFPTSVRNSIMGVLSMSSRIGQMVAPQINVLSETASEVIFGAAAIICGFLCYFLPETKNIELPSSLEESEMLTKEMVRLEEDDVSPVILTKS